MRHLWTMVTTVNTVTSDAGEAEWLDLPLTDFVLPESLNLDERPVELNLDPAWLILSKWLLDEVDVGFPLIPIVEIRDPCGYTLFNEIPALSSFEGAFIPREFSITPILLDVMWSHLMYTRGGVYTFIVRWTGSPATRDAGQFSLTIAEPLAGGKYG